MESTIPTSMLLLMPEYARAYLAWAYDFGMLHCPEELHPSSEFGVVYSDGTVRFTVRLLDAVGGGWVASGMGPTCPPTGWTLDSPNFSD